MEGGVGGGEESSEQRDHEGRRNALVLKVPGGKNWPQDGKNEFGIPPLFPIIWDRDAHQAIEIH